MTLATKVTGRRIKATSAWLAGVCEGSVSVVCGAIDAEDINVVKDEDLTLGTAAEADVVQLEEDGSIKESGNGPAVLECEGSGGIENARDVEGKSRGTSVIEICVALNGHDDALEEGRTTTRRADSIVPDAVVGGKEGDEIPSDAKVPEEGKSRDPIRVENLKVAFKRVLFSRRTASVPRVGGGLVSVGWRDVEEVLIGVKVGKLVCLIDLKVKERCGWLGDGPSVLDKEASGLEASVKEGLTESVCAGSIDTLRLDERRAKKGEEKCHKHRDAW